MDARNISRLLDKSIDLLMVMVIFETFDKRGRVLIVQIWSPCGWPYYPSLSLFATLQRLLKTRDINRIEVI